MVSCWTRIPHSFASWAIRIGSWELAQALRTRRPALKILFVSGYTQEVVLAPEQMADGIQFLPKPFTPEALRAAVARAFQA
jgi:FixJ family two-component response regulator